MEPDVSDHPSSSSSVSWDVHGARKRGRKWIHEDLADMLPAQHLQEQVQQREPLLHDDVQHLALVAHRPGAADVQDQRRADVRAKKQRQQGPKAMSSDIDRIVSWVSTAFVPSPCCDT